jgi:hypothetical protein
MEQMNVEEHKKILIDYDDSSLSKFVRQFRPMIYRDGDQFCCILGPNPESGVFACSDTLESALSEWTEELKKRASTPGSNDEVKQYINDTLNQSVDDVW